MPRLIVTADNASDQIAAHRLRTRGKHLYGEAGCLPRKTAFGTIRDVKPATMYYKRIPRNLWPNLIRSQTGTFLGDLTRPNLAPHDQGATNYCWAHGSVRTLEALRVYMGQEARLLSAESVAVPVTGGVNRGGTPDEALEQIRQHGACRQELWPKNDLDPRHATPGWEADAFDHAILGWADIENFDDQMTLALHRVPIAIGLRWWGHLVCQLDPIIFPDGTFGIGCDNSWGPDYGDNGYFELTEDRGTADLGAFAPVSATYIPNAFPL